MMNLKDTTVDTHFNSETNTESFIPLMNYNIKCMSIGFLTGEKQVIAWRSPLAVRAVLQMFDQVLFFLLSFFDLARCDGDTQILMF